MITNLKDRITALKESTTNQDVVLLASVAEQSCSQTGEHLKSMIAESLIADLEPYKDDKATQKFIVREQRMIAINNLGIKNLLQKISESELMYNHQTKYTVEYYMQQLNTIPEYVVAHNLVEQLSTMNWHKEVAEGLAEIKENLETYKEDIFLCNFINEFKNSTGDYLTKFFVNEFDSYFINRDEYTKKQLLEKIQPYLYDGSIKVLDSFLKENSAGLQAYSDNIAEIKNIYSPIISLGESAVFFSSGRFLKKTGNNISQLSESEFKALPQDFIMLVEFVNSPNVVISYNKATVYTKNKKVEIIKEGENTIIKLNDKTFPRESFTKYFMNEGIFHADENAILGNCLNLYENFDSIYEIDFGKRILSKVNENLWFDVFKLGESITTIRIDSHNGVNEMYSPLNATQTKTLVQETIGFDISKSLRDLLPEEEAKLNSYKTEVVAIEESIKSLIEKKSEILSEIENDALLKNDNTVKELLEAIDTEVTKLNESKSTFNNIINNLEKVSIGLTTEDFINEAGSMYDSISIDELKDFWNNLRNKNSVLYFAQDDGKGRFLVGSQSYDQFKNNCNWTVEEFGLKPQEAVSYAQELAEQIPDGVYFSTDDASVYESKDPDGNTKFDKSRIKEDCKNCASSANELQPGDKIRMKNGKIGVVNSINDTDGTVIVNMEDGKAVEVPKHFLHELEIIDKKNKDSKEQIKTADGSQSVQIQEGIEEYIPGEVKYKGKVLDTLISAIDYTTGGDNDFVEVQLTDGGEKLSIKKKDVKVTL